MKVYELKKILEGVVNKDDFLYVYASAKNETNKYVKRVSLDHTCKHNRIIEIIACDEEVEVEIV